jgi:hypothetical protein
MTRNSVGSLEEEMFHPGFRDATSRMDQQDLISQIKQDFIQIGWIAGENFTLSLLMALK